MAYEFENGTIRGWESKILERIDWERLLTYPSLRDTWNELVRLKIGYHDVNDNERIDSIDKLYTDNFLYLYKEIAELLLNESLKMSLLIEIDFTNLKLFNRHILKESDDYSEILDGGWFGREKLLYSFKNNDWATYPDFFDKISINFKEESNKLSEQSFDLLLDNKLFELRLDAANKNNSPFLINFWKLMIDFINCRQFFNLLKTNQKNPNYFIHGGNIETNDWALLDEHSLQTFIQKTTFWEYLSVSDEMRQAFENDLYTIKWQYQEEHYLLKYFDDAVAYAGSFEPIFSYWYRRLTELKNVNRLLYGKTYNLSNNIIRSQLSNSYIF
ncbi:V-type ATPase subunit [bacterium]